MKGDVRDPFIPDSSPIVGATGRSPLRRVLGANFSHLGVISNDVTANVSPPTTSRCSLPLFGSHLQRRLQTAARRALAHGAVSLHLGVISNAYLATAHKRALAGAVSLHLGVISNARSQRRKARPRHRVQSPFIWESSPTEECEQCHAEEVQSPFIWESSPTGTS